MPGLNIQVSANVQNAVQGLNTVQQKLAQTAVASGKLGGSVAGINQASNALMNLGRIAQDAPFGFIGIQNNINPLLESFQRLKAESGSTSAALRALGASFLGGGGLGLAISVATGLLTVFAQQGLFKASQGLDDTAKNAERAKDAIHGIFEDTAKEVTQVQSLVVILESETATRKRKLDAIKELQRLEPEVFTNLKLEGNAVIGLDQAYQSYLSNLGMVIAAKIKQQQLEQITTKLLERQGVTQLGIAKTITRGLKDFAEQAERVDPAKRTATQTLALTQYQKEQKSINELQQQQTTLLKELSELQAGIKIPDFKDPKPVKDKVDQVSEVLRKLKIDRDELAQNPLLNFTEKDLKTFDLIQSAITRLRELKVAEKSPIVISLRAELDQIASQIQIDKFRDRLQKTGLTDVVVDIPIETSFKLRKNSGLVDIATKNLKDLEALKLPSKLATKVAQSLFDPEKFKDATDKAKNYIKDTTSFVKSTIDPIFSAVFDNIGQGSQKALLAVGEAIKGIITQLIRAAAEAAVLSLILNAIMPGAGGKFSFASMFSQLSGIPKFADGGIAYGPTVGLFGEAGPEAIVPLNKLPEIIARSGVSSDGGNMTLTAQITGNNIYLSNARTVNSRKRIYGK
jgi:hypothetical protein